MIARETIKERFSLFCHLANITIIRNITFECSLNVLKQVVQLKKEIVLLVQNLQIHIFRHHLTNYYIRSILFN